MYCGSHRPTAGAGNGLPAPSNPGAAFAGKQVLQASIVVLGTGLSLAQVAHTGLSSLPVMLGTLALCLLVTWGAGRLLGLRGSLPTLIGVGTGICGASAIAATTAVIGAAEVDVAYAISTIFAFNIVGVQAPRSARTGAGCSAAELPEVRVRVGYPAPPFGPPVREGGRRAEVGHAARAGQRGETGEKGVDGTVIMARTRHRSIRTVARYTPARPRRGH